jgi:phage terminase large subunit-like protein
MSAGSRPEGASGAHGSLAEGCSSLRPSQLKRFISTLSEGECRALLHDWNFWARPNQLAPIDDWFCWLVLAGRGFGKTRMGVEWVRSRISGTSPLSARRDAPERIALVSQTMSDGRDVVVEGESGFLAHSPPNLRPHFEPSRRRLVWPNGVKAYIYSGDEPDQLRGPQHHLAWADELAKWRHSESAWSNLILGLRLGPSPQVMVTTTPKPLPLIKRLLEDSNTVVTRGSTFENARNLSPRFIAEMRRTFEGTRLGRQELYGELLEDTPGALWSRDLLEKGRKQNPGDLRRIVVAVDPPVSSGPEANRCGIIVAGQAGNGEIYILDDRSIQGASPHGWAMRALAAYKDYEADRLVAEVNNGGDLVEALIRQLEPEVSFRAVRASRGKITRAEPVAALYERRQVHHVQHFRDLEEELCHYTGAAGDVSPDRLDALVWAVTDLALSPASEPRIRMV